MFQAYVGYSKGDINSERRHNECTDSTNRNHVPAVATGNWGCGAFRGNVRLKGLLQMMACAAAGRDIVYYTFGDARLRDLLHSIHCFFQRHSVTIAQLWRYLCKFNEAQLPARQLYPFIQQSHLDSITNAQTSPIKEQPQINNSSKERAQSIESTTNAQNSISQKQNTVIDINHLESFDDIASCNIIESSQPELDVPKDYICELFLKKQKLKRNDKEMKKNHEDIRSFLYSSDEEDSTVTASSSMGLLQAADSFQNMVETPETIKLNDSCEKMECDSIEQLQQKSVQVSKTPSKAYTTPSKSNKNSEKSAPSKKISDYFKVVTK